MKSYFEKFVEKIENDRNNFWEKEYPNMSFEEKKTYWLTSTHKSMRTQGEAFADEYSAFSKKWHDFAMSNEPNFEEIFKYVTNNLGFKFDWNEYNKRIQA